jgi:hypothetical protein
VRTTEPIAKSASTPKVGLFATLRVFLRRQGTGALSSSLATGSAAPSLVKPTLLFLPALVLAALALTAAPALAAGPPETPELTVEDATYAVATPSVGARLHGVLNPKAAGEPGTYQFLYKSSNAGACEGGAVAPASPGISFGGEREEYYETVTGLSANTEYAVCLRVESTATQTVTVTPPVTFKTALPPERPETLSPAKSITATSATFEGVLNPIKAGEAGTYEFLYRVSPTECEGERASPTEPAGVMSGAAKQAVSVPVSALQPNATYTFCLLARNTAGETAVGPPVPFTTPPAPPTVESESTSNVKTTEARLEGVLNPNNELTECKFQYGTDPLLKTGVTTRLCEPGSFTASFGGQGVGLNVGELQASTTYYYRIVAENEQSRKEGKPGEGAIEHFTTAFPFAEAPEAKPANPIAATEATLHGVLNPKSERTSEPGSAEFVYRQSPTECRGENEKQAGDEKTPEGHEAEAAEAKLSELSPGTTYTFCVRVVNKAGEEAVSSSQTFTTPAVAPVVEEESVSELSATSATLSAKINPGGANTTYRFEYGTGAEYKPVPGGEGYVGAGAAGMVVSVRIGAGLTPSTTYHFRVIATGTVEVTGEEHTFTTQAMAEGSPTAGGLPDGRVYEQVSPANKNGNVVRPGNLSIGLAKANGEAVVFTGSGPMGAAASGLDEVFVARRSGSGWATSATRPLKPGEVSYESGRPLTLVPSLDFSSFLFTTYGSYTLTEPPGDGVGANVYLSHDPSVEATWIAQPTIANWHPALGENNGIRDYLVVGGTSDFSTAYFTYSGTLMPQDASRAGGWGFYEWSGGALREAGILPDGTLSPFGAVPAAIGGAPFRAFVQPFEPQALDNEVSTDGSRAFFVSPDPSVASGAPPELYVRDIGADGAKRSVLVSRSMLPGHEGEPAPDGPVDMVNTPVENASPAGASYVYASADGSQAFFASVDQLTSAAPADGSTKWYDYSLDTGSVTYLPGVTGSIASASPDGSDFIFENNATVPAELDLWTRGPAGGTVTTITQLPESVNVGGPSYGHLDVSGGRASADGAAFVFRTNAPVAGFNDGGGFEQVFHYWVASHELTCVSCPPSGVTPSGNAEVSYNDASEEPLTTLDSRVMSSDGSRVFFDTPDPLVSQAANAPARDVYEWENGHVSLISSGSSNEDSFVLDSSASGGDVFFTTTAGLVPGDVDEVRDVYDARVPRLGDRPPPSTVPCEGDVCQGPPSVPHLLSPPASETFNGAGNLTPVTPSIARPKPKTAAQIKADKLVAALRTCRKKSKRKARSFCEKQARRKYGSKARAKRSDRRASQ